IWDPTYTMRNSDLPEIPGTRGPMTRATRRRKSSGPQSKTVKLLDDARELVGQTAGLEEVRAQHRAACRQVYDQLKTVRQRRLGDDEPVNQSYYGTDFGDVPPVSSRVGGRPYGPDQDVQPKDVQQWRISDQPVDGRVPGSATNPPAVGSSG